MDSATISPALVKQLRDETGAGMMDCKNALTGSEGKIVKAQELFRKKGLASADEKASRPNAEGRMVLDLVVSKLHYSDCYNICVEIIS